MDTVVTKIKVRTGAPTEWEVHVLRPSKIGGTESAAVRSSDIPCGDMLNALAAIRRHIVHMLESRQEWAQSMQVVLVEIDRKEDPPFYKLTAEKRLQGFESPVKLSAPAAQFTGEALEDLRALERYALEYAKGKRAQVSLFEAAAEAAEKARKDGREYLDKRGSKKPAKQPPIDRRRRPFAN